MRRAVLFPIVLLLSGCTTTFKEDHYFKSVSQFSGKPTNYFRLRISGRACFSSARYISGYYDERALDLFFDEMKGASSQDEAKIETVFQGGKITLADDTVIAPLSPTPKNGALVMIFSTNAKAVANTIGAFAESQVTADAITHLVNRDVVREAVRAEVTTKVAEQKAKAVAAELETLANALPTGDSPAKDATQQSALRLLSAIAQAQGHNGSFQTIDEARGWFQARNSGGNS